MLNQENSQSTLTKDQISILEIAGYYDCNLNKKSKRKNRNNRNKKRKNNKHMLTGSDISISDLKDEHKLTLKIGEFYQEYTDGLRYIIRQKCKKQDIYCRYSKEHIAIGDLYNDNYYLRLCKDIEHIGFTFTKKVYTFIRSKLIAECGMTVKRLRNIIRTMKQLNTFKFCISHIVKNPYDFIKEDSYLITFKQAEKINQLLDLKIKMTTRIDKWVIYYFLHKNNSFYIERKKLADYFIEELNWKFNDFVNYDIPKNDLNNLNVLGEYLMKEVCIKKRIDGKKYMTTQYLLDVEKNTTDLMIRLYCNNLDDDVDNDNDNDNDNLYEDGQIEQFINEYEIKNEIKLIPKQRLAIKNCINNKFNVICGYPGTGKTTIVDVVKEFEYKCDTDTNICLMAPTGLAVKNLYSKCTVKRKQIMGTCHKLVYNIFPNIIKSQEYYEENEDKFDIDGNYICTDDEITKLISKQKIEIIQEHELYKLKPNLIILDEISMVDMFMFKRILEFCQHFGCKLILLGDKNQLPSIGPGFVLHQIIKCNLFNIDNLTQILRQSGILMKNIKKMNKQILTLNDFDNNSMIFNHFNTFDKQNSTKGIKIDSSKIKKLIDDNGFDQKNTQFITSQKDYNGGAIMMNNILQNIYNKNGLLIESHKSYYENEFRCNDYVIRKKNNYENEQIFANGDMGVIEYYGYDKDDNGYGDMIVTIKYHDGSVEKVDVRTLYDEFLLSYCITIHKSQGCQYDNVVLIISNKHSYMWTRDQDSKKLLYTAISRAKSKCIIIGDEHFFIRSQKNISKPISLFMEESDNYEMSDI